jgi:hypothetical protein
VECVGSPAHIPFIIRPRSEVASPEGVLVIRVGEHVVVLGAPLDLIFGYGINVH